MSQRIIKKIDIAMEAIWLLIIFLVPLYFDRFIFNPWEMAKNILFQSLTEILLCLFLIKIIIVGKYEFFTNIKIKIKYLIPGIIFIIILGISTIFSQVPWFSFWGSWERRMGYLAWLHFFIFAAILFFNLKTEIQIRRIIVTILIASSLVVIYGFIQLLGLEPFEWSEEAFTTHRVYSTIGQPNFYGSWLLLVIPLIFYSLIIFKNFYARFFISLLFIASLISLIFTQSRGGWIGFSLTIFLFFIISAWLKKKKKIVALLLILFTLLIGLTIYLNFHPPKFTPTDNPFIYRLKTLTNLKVFGRYRLMHWQASLDIIKNRILSRILIGSGLGSQRFNLPKYYQPEFAIYEAPNIYLDYTHNDILDMLLTSGVLGLISYLYLIGNAICFGFKKLNQGSQLPKYLIIGLFGYLVSLQFSFHVMSTLLYFWLFIIFLIINTQQPDNEIIQKDNRAFKIFSIILVIFLTCLSIWWFNLRLYLSSHYLLKATIEKLQGHWSSMIKYHQLAVGFQPDNPYFRQQFAFDLLEASSYQTYPQKAIEFLSLGIRNIEAIPEQEWPMEARNWICWLLTQKANLTKNWQDFAKAETYYQKLADFVPGAALTYNNWCGLKIYEENWSEAIKICQKALDLYPDINHPYLNPEHRQKIIDEMVAVYEKLAIIYSQTKDYQKAISNYKKILQLNPRQTPILMKLADLYVLTGDFETAISYLYHGHILEPNNPIWTDNLAFLYQKQGNLKKANYWREKTIEIQKQKKGIYQLP